ARKTQVAPAKEGAAIQIGYLGIHVAPDGRGKLAIDVVEADSPAAQAGLQAGDVLVRLEQEPASSAEGLREFLQSRVPGAAIQLGIARQGRMQEVTATLAATSRPKKLASQRTVLGLFLGEPAEEGTPITRVIPGSPADRAGLRVGEVITRVDGVPLTASAS